MLRDGFITCWEPGIPGAFPPQFPPEDNQFASISIGIGGVGYERDTHFCGVKLDGSVECWGDNHYGQAAPPEGEFTSVSAGFEHTCGLRRDGMVECWGIYRKGPGSPGNPENPIDQASLPGGEFVSISSGGKEGLWEGGHSCGLRSNGAVECWGNNSESQATAPVGEFVSVSAGGDYTCGVRTSGFVACWGSRVRGVTEAQADRAALIALYNATDGPNWTESAGWNTGAPISAWQGVHTRSGRVTGLDLDNNGLSGSIPPQLGNLTELNNLRLGENQLSGEIPLELGNLTKLTGLSLDENQLSGEIPPELGSLANLEVLDLEDNQLSGCAPAGLNRDGLEFDLPDTVDGFCP